MQGGGIPEDSLEQVFQYGYTTVDDGELSQKVTLLHWPLQHALHMLQLTSSSSCVPRP